MKVKTSVSLSQDVLEEIDRIASPGESRSEFIEQALKQHFRLKRREERSKRERAALQRLLETPGFESDTLEYGVDPSELGDDVELLPDDLSRRQAS